MGHKWEIQVWKCLGSEYGYEYYWAGQSAWLAVWNMLKAKFAGYGCVTLHWR